MSDASSIWEITGVRWGLGLRLLEEKTKQTALTVFIISRKRRLPSW